MKNRLRVVLSVAALLPLIATCAQAVTISTNSDGQNPLYGASATWGPTVNMVNNVLVGLTPTAQAGAWPEYDPTPGSGVLGVSALTDGVLGPIGKVGVNSSVSPFTYANGAGNYYSADANSATYVFAATKLSTIEVYGGHIDGPLNRIHYNVDVSTDGGTTWTALGVDADFTPPESISGVASSVGKTTLSDDGAGTSLLGANGLTVNALRVNFLGSGNYYYGTGYLEVAAYKVVPEPSSLALLTAGLIGLLAYAWKKRK